MATNYKIARNVPPSAREANKEEEELNLVSLAECITKHGHEEIFQWMKR